ncbi:MULTISPECIES: cytochrome c oxidase subunit 3 [Virgibacillus]|uniref:Cytochrome aa3 quinol oxidase subunit III n=3 Tax=Bacillaceae TaxID=186817 RepID=A0A0L0QS49_VIRPA|nr:MULTISPECIES: cytochrome c oxidase subunit 3 [Virgibacillus]KNE21490.1 cytochrome aa3 quinol oxidase subunit III [Virgibacillus pantothenticus]MEB5450670.1 cytochrome c oxidase subunit 3 [Virgibacillus pantothenticus]MEB5464310.1 cytochrome c oxidase subunit 3 [Virgibacillus pantothenticus]SIS72420.1 cytochrome c oxidase subunit 3/cytochrome o ubiquinol oxidase subunit 3/cytochrome aa3-600 menaquinol oxidase subunit 3 [Virgibacillus pantothenticus]
MERVMVMRKQETELFQDKKVGFFIYLGVEAVMFAVLFATYMIFTPAGSGPYPSDVFQAKMVLLSSLFLLSSSVTLYVAEKGIQARRGKKTLLSLGLTLGLAIVFLGLESYEFYTFVQEGYGLSTSVFLSSFYVLVGLHAVHVAFGIGWMIVLFIHYVRPNVSYSLYKEKQTIFSYYWHFVDGIWVFIILIVYLPYLV